MLVETNKKGDVVTIKLTTSEELICSYVEDDADSYTVDRPFMVGITQPVSYTHLTLPTICSV